jgi:hypothetical protein
MRANMSQPAPASAALIRFSIAVCHSSISCSLPRQFLDISGRVFKRDELAAAGQRYRVVERAFPPVGFFTKFVPLLEAETRDTCTSTCPARAWRAVSE